MRPLFELVLRFSNGFSPEKKVDMHSARATWVDEAPFFLLHILYVSF